MALNDMYGMLVILGIGVGGALIAFFAEIVFKSSGSGNGKLNYVE